MDTSNTKTPSIAKLNSTNFLTWKNDIMSILSCHELTRYLTRDPPRIPQVAIENDEGVAIQQNTTDPIALIRYEEELDRFEIKSFKALSILCLYMDQNRKTRDPGVYNGETSVDQSVGSTPTAVDCTNRYAAS